FGYAYVDCKCAPLELIIPTAGCQGQSATLTAPPQSDGTYAWTGSGPIVGATTNSVITTNTAGTYTVKITNQQGCSYTLDTTIAFFPNPIVAVNSPTTCAGNAVVLNATSTGSAGALTYAWNPMTNLTAVHDSTATATVNSNTSYVVTGTSVHGCTATATSNIVTTGAPPPTFSAPPVCLGASTVINNTTAGGGTFDWDFGDASAVVTNQTSPTHIYATTGTFVVTSTVTLAGCVGTGTANVIVNPIPTATIGAPPVCVGTATTFTSTVTNGNTYTWDYGDPVGSSAAGSATPSHTYAAPNTYAVTVTVTAAAPTSCTVTATTNAIVSVVPTASFSVAPVCMGTASVFDASASTPAAGLTYAWSFGGTAPNTDVVATPTDNHTYSSANTFPVTLTVSVGSCSATTTGNAVVNPFPVLGFTANHPCDGAPMNITNNTSAPATISNWNWDFGDGASSTVNPPPAHTYSAAGCYSVVLTATASTGCSGSHDTVVYIHPNPVASFTAIEQCLGTPSDFLDGSVIQNPACLSDQITAWSYDFGDGTVTPFTSANIPISPADSIKHTYATCGPKNIIVTVTTNNACTNTSTLIGDTVFCPPVVVAPLDYTVCPGAPTPVQAFTTTCINGGNAFSVWGEFTFVTGAPASYLFNPQVSPNFDVVPSYAAIATNPLCSVIRDTVFAVPISGAGCVGNSTYYIANVWPTPTVTPVASATVCPNAMVPAVTFAGCPGVAATETFTWTATGDNVGLASPGAGNIATFAGQNALPGSVVAISTVSVTPLAHGCSGPGTTFSVTVDPIPTMTVTSPLPYCPAATIASTDYNISTTPAVGVTYTWTATNNPGTGMLAGGTGAAPSASYPAPANPSQVNQISVVTYTPSLNGCIGASVSDTITIKPTPIMVAMPDQAFCPGVMTNSVNLATLPASPASTFSWSSNAPPIGASGNSNSIPAFGPTQNPGLTTLGIAVTVTPTLNGCVGPPSGFNIYVYPSPIAKFSASKLVCEGLSMNFSDLSVPNTGTNTVNNWAWDMGNDGSVDASGKNPVPYTFPAGVTGSIPVSLTVTTVNTCTAQVIENVYVNPNPVPDFVGDNLKSCPNLLTNFTYVVTPIVPYVKTTYTWNFGNGKNLTAISNPPPAAPIPVAPGTQTYTNSSPTTAQFYTVTLTAVTDSTCKGVQTKAPYVEVYPHPIANFTWGPTDADIDNSTITFVNEAIGVSTYTPAPMTYGPNGIDYTLGDIYTPVPALNYHAGNGDPHEQFIHTYEHYDTATYNVTQWVINKYGCRDSIVKPVYIGPNFTFYIPNAFSPNGDGTNEGFKGLGVGIDNTTYNLWVFDRWGLMIFYADDIDKSWDGHMRGNDSKPVLQEDVYVWKVKFHDFTGKLHEYHGTVTLLK
ncbi:MAG TPA: PKD domain-containing protein, partial [Bacteroidia bacterium]|nr:PKD domain-containing protein [Bacteroidia bacterium]